MHHNNGVYKGAKTNQAEKENFELIKIVGLVTAREPYLQIWFKSVHWLKKRNT